MSRTEVFGSYARITFSMLLAAAGLYFFMIPGNVIIGGIAGVSMVLTRMIPLSISVITFLLNIVLLLLGFLFVGREFGSKTVYTTLVFPFFLFVFEQLFPKARSLTGEMLADMLCGILILSMGQAVMFQENASSGGLDIVAKIINKYLHVDIGKAVSICGGLVVASSILVYDSKTLVIGFLGIYLNGLAVDFFINGFTRKKRVCVISEHYQDIQKFIVEKVRRGVTLYPAVGGYSGKEQMEVVTILDKREYGKLMEYIKEAAPDAFITVTTVSDVVGIWNRKGKEVFL